MRKKGTLYIERTVEDFIGTDTYYVLLELFITMLLFFAQFIVVVSCIWLMFWIIGQFMQ
jgi:hypothetical protein